jgi:hypothetical protein
MTTTIDHAIQIPAATGVVWVQVSNPDFFPRWQVDCKRIAYLTTQRKGKGTRMRCVGASGKEYVMEITAWYEGLGFEYRIVDGSSYEENRGRIRLQEIAEGTIVQWTFTYALRGIFGGLRNSMGMKRTIESQITDSLKNFFRYIRDTAGEDSIKLVKAGVKDAPSVEQRANYKPRHPSRYEETRHKDKITTGTMRAIKQNTYRPIIDEPLPAEDDTRPNPVTHTENPVIVPTTPQPFKPATTPPAPPMMPAPPPGTIIPASPIHSTSIPQVPSVRPPSQPTRPDFAEPLPSPQPQVVAQPPRPQTEPERPAASLSPAPVEQPAINPVTKPPTAPTAMPVQPEPKPELNPVVDSPKSDTSRMSVFEIFGLQKPSETQQMRAVQLAKEIREQLTAPTQERLNPVATVRSLYSDEEKAERDAFMANMPSAGDVQASDLGRSGLRSRMRQNLLALRRPKKR